MFPISSRSTDFILGSAIVGDSPFRGSRDSTRWEPPEPNPREKHSSKINKGYISLFEYLVDINFSLANWLDKKLYPLEHEVVETHGSRHRKYNPKPYFGQQFLGAFQALQDMGKDFGDTFKPYKSNYHARRDFLQPVHGLKNILQGALSVVGGSFALVFFFLQLFHKPIRALRNIGRALSWMLDGVFRMFRGITQIPTTPLTWFLKMPIRAGITSFKGKPWWGQNPGLQAIVHDGMTIIADDRILIDEFPDMTDANDLLEQTDKSFRRSNSHEQPNNTSSKISYAEVTIALHLKSHKRMARSQPSNFDDMMLELENDDAMRLTKPYMQKTTDGKKSTMNKVTFGRYFRDVSNIIEADMAAKASSGASVKYKRL